MDETRIRQFYTYLHCTPDCVPFYVGKGHSYRAFRFDYRSQYHQRIVAKHGAANIRVFVFPCESESQAIEDEILQIAQLRRDGYRLCNLTDGGDGASGAKRTPEHIAIMSRVHKGKLVSAETKRKISESQRGKPGRRLGKPNSEETRQKMSESHKGVALSAEHKARISEGQTGKKRKPFTDEHRKNISLGKQRQRGITYA